MSPASAAPLRTAGLPLPDPAAPMRRVLVIGPGGGGKSTLASRISQATGLPVIHLDAHYWREGWKPVSSDRWAEIVAELVRRPAWIMDGNYGGTLDVRIEAADTIVFLDWPRTRCIARVLRRRLAFRGRSRPSMPEGCPERLTPAFLWWIWTYPRRRRAGVLERLGRARPEKRVLVLRRRHEVEAFLQRLRSGRGASRGAARDTE